MINLKSKDLLGTKDLSLEEINLIFETTKKFKEVLARPIKKVPPPVSYTPLRAHQTREERGWGRGG